MHQDRASLSNSLVNEVARGREMDKEIRVVNVFDRNPQLPYPASRNVSWDRVRADGHDMGDPPLRDRSRSASGDQAVSGHRRELLGTQKRSDGKGDKARTFQAGVYPR